MGSSKILNEPSQDPQAFIYMKAGQHAGEPVTKILERKAEEFDRTGWIFWGYGGTLIHPITQVQPFGKRWDKEGVTVQALMGITPSRHHSNTPPATQYSTDNTNWFPIPEGIQVTGSRHALVIGKMESVTFDLDLNKYVVGIGPKEGRSAAHYIHHRVDKGCFQMAPLSGRTPVFHRIKLRAQLMEPYGVMVR